MTKVLDHGFIELVDHMGDDSAIAQAARISYGKDQKNVNNNYVLAAREVFKDPTIRMFNRDWSRGYCTYCCQGSEQDFFIYEHSYKEVIEQIETRSNEIHAENVKKDRNLIRYLLRHSHTTPFEMVEFKFVVQAPMDVMRQWIRHRTANVNEYSTRYTEAIDLCHSTLPGEWRLQAADNKQGSSGFLDKRADEVFETPQEARDLFDVTPMSFEKVQDILSDQEQVFHNDAQRLYQARLRCGVAKEQARKDLPLSTYTRLYWKCDLHNIFNFLRLRMDSHAQWEIRQYANAMYELIKPIVPVACEAFEDYVLQALRFSRMEMELIKAHMTKEYGFSGDSWEKPIDMSDREWKEFLGKLS